MRIAALVRCPLSQISMECSSSSADVAAFSGGGQGGLHGSTECGAGDTRCVPLRSVVFRCVLQRLVELANDLRSRHIDMEEISRCQDFSEKNSTK